MNISCMSTIHVTYTSLFEITVSFSSSFHMKIRHPKEFFVLPSRVIAVTKCSGKVVAVYLVSFRLSDKSDTLQVLKKSWLCRFDTFPMLRSAYLTPGIT